MTSNTSLPATAEAEAKSGSTVSNLENKSNFGVITSVRGSVVDIKFDNHLPPIYTVLHVGDKEVIVIEVLAQIDARHVRGIALTPTQGLARGMAVTNTGETLKAPRGCLMYLAMPLIASLRR
jgi:F0F1-type ATP synthase beta subunit